MKFRYALLWPFCCFVGGILVGGFSTVTLQWAYITALASIVATVIFVVFWKKINRLTSGILFLLLGFAFSIWQNQSYFTSHFTRLPTAERTYLAKVLHVPTPTKRAYRLELELLCSEENPDEKISGKTFIYVPKNTAVQQLLPGDLLLLRAQLQDARPPQNPHEFDYRNYLHLHQIFGQAYTPNIQILNLHVFRYNRPFSVFRNRLLDTIKQMELAPQEEAIAVALLLGYRHLLSQETEREFAGAGAMHVLAVSGLHVGILYLLTAFALRIDSQKRYKNKWYKIVATIAVIWLYATLTGLSPSVSRAAVMFTFIAIGQLSRRPPATYQAILISAFILLIYQPNNLFQVGFQLSYAAVFGILYLQPKIYRLVPKINNIVLEKIWAITAVSIAAQAATFSFGLYYFHQFPLYFLISNLIVIPLAWLLMVYGIFLLSVSFIFLPSLLVWPFKMLLKIMLFCVGWVENLPHAVLHEINISRLELVLIFVLTFAVASTLFNRKKPALFLSLVLGICLLGINNVNYWREKNQQHITFYSIKNETAIEIVQGRIASLFASPKLLKNPDAQLFYLKHNQWAHGLKTIDEQTLNQDTTTALATYNAPLISALNQRILVAKSISDFAFLWARPTLIYVEKGVWPPEQIPQNVPVILANGLSQKAVTAWQKVSQSVHNLAEDGAFVHEISH